MVIPLLVSFAGCLVTHPADRLWKLAFWSSLAGWWICFVGVLNVA
jgi:hypothetical protein